ncbi:hypothetical protein H0H92_011170 [Tricholoma furcatifolium]|nr:hypothetical protein H0H92_011170 [Tricholoma furcatifolium]
MPLSIDESVVVQIPSHAPIPEDGLFTFTSAVKNIAFGSVAGMVAEVFEYPFDLAKVRLQAQILYPSSSTNLPRFKGPLDCLTQTWTEEGLRGLYRGLSVPMVGAMAQTAALFVTYSGFQDIIRSMTSRTRTEKLTIPELGLAAGAAGFASSFIITPIELVKCKLQVQMMNPSNYRLPPLTSISTTPVLQQSVKVPIFSSPKHISAASKASLPFQRHPHSTVAIGLPPGPLGVLRETLQANGVRGLWLGHTGTLVRETGGTAAWFAIKEVVAELLLRRRNAHGASQSLLSRNSEVPVPIDTATELLPWESALSGAVAGGICVLAFYPADTVKSAMQTEDELKPSSSSVRRASATSGHARTFTGTLVRMYAAHGLKGLYAGCGMTVARAVPSSGIIFIVYDGLAAWLG